MKLQTSVLLLVLTAAVSAQERCCAPKQYMAGNGGMVAQIDSTGPSAFNVYEYGAFDYINRAFGFNMYISYPNGTNSAIRLIQKYNEGSQWVILDDVQYCQKMPVQYPEPFACIPDAATYLGSSIMGGPNGTLTDVWSVVYTGQRGDPIDGTLMISVTREGCYGFGASIIATRYDDGSKSNPVPFVSSTGVVNMTLGIPEPDKWFTVPSFCSGQDNHISSRRPRSILSLDFLDFPLL